MAETIGSTGRIGKRLTPIARKILFARDLDQHIEKDLPHICQIDCAHILMLVECGILSPDPARKLLKAILRLVESQYAPLHQRSSERGIFLLYEEYLIESEGAAVGGMLQTGRSRNDLGATLFRLRLRRHYAQLIHAAFRLQAILLRRGKTYAETVMPAYTHGQPAEPITFGHYLAGVAEAVRRDIEGLLEAAREIDTCPLGAAAVAGTPVPINPGRTAALLGFTRRSSNSIDAVASRDLALRLLAAMSIYGATLSRLATDLLQWLTGEFNFLSLPDELVGSSSAMPQKRNPFLLEHVQGRTASALGSFTSSLAATRNVPFTNSINTGTESVRPMWGALQDITDASTLLRLVLAKVQPVPERMMQRAAESFTNATALAIRLALEAGMDYRSAHRRVGSAVTEALAGGMNSFKDLADQNEELFGLPLNGIDPASCVRSYRYGGGPASENIQALLAQLSKQWSSQRRSVLDQTNRWRAAAAELENAVQAFVGPSISPSRTDITQIRHKRISS
ncbi:MAG TPA: argininosuccinate lyase [Candidatus Angelobacter sp.]|nr:argininosuccinate lyase [Candidatus Angelobacter sp.]